MITRENIRELAEFEAKSNEECAITFYFQPRTPQNKSHREEAIEAKDLVRNALKEAEKCGKNGAARADLDRIHALASSLHGNQARAKAVFACGARDFWREYDLPPQLPGTQVAVNRRFHLKPLALLLGAQPKIGVAIIDRQTARFFGLRLDVLTERETLINPLPRRGRGDGYAGYDAGHAERRINDEALHHLKQVSDRLKTEAESGVWEKLIIGCPDITWAQLEAHLHPYVKQRLIGRFAGEVANISVEQIKSQADKVLRDFVDSRRSNLMRDVLAYARSHKRGVTGLRRVLRSLEMGEVQVLLMSANYSSKAVECTNCGHLDAHLVQFCPVCGRATRELEDVCEAIIPNAIRRDIELLYYSDPELDRVGNIAALLRFRADHNTAAELSVAS